MIILVLNSWSSSLKYQLFKMPENQVIAKGLVDKIALGNSILTHKIWDEKIVVNEEFKNHREALDAVLKIITTWDKAVLKDLSEIDAIGHRVVHGWEFFSSSTIINDNIIACIEKCKKLAPLHNPANKEWIMACLELMPNTPQVAVFDTAYHQTMSKDAYLYAIPYEYYEKYKIRKYWFHWTSHKYVSERACEILGKKIEDTKVITCHVWNGCSVAAIKWWKVIDTSMGFTPLEWLMMGTRSWDLDPAVITFLEKNENLSPAEMDDVLNKKSGVLWVSQISNDLRDIEDGFLAWKERETIVMNMYITKIAKYIWSYTAVLDWVNIIVLTAWILENSAVMRKLLVDKLGWLGITLDEVKNNFRWEERIISTPDSKTTVIVIPTNEEYMIAKDTYELVSK